MKTLRDDVVAWIKQTVGNCKVVIGISGGKDSSIVAAACVAALGKENVRFLNREDFIKAIENSKQQKGMTFCLIFYYSNPGYIDKEISHLAFTKIKDVLLNYCSKEILFNEYSNHQILISHLSIYTKSKAMQFIKTISNDILKILTVLYFREWI